MFNFTTGPSLVPDIGTLSYNGCEFSPLFVSNVSGNAIKDNATRTVKYMEYAITADGYVTLATETAERQSGQEGVTINATMATLQLLLCAQGGYLQYTGRGFDIVVNPPGGSLGLSDVAWGPVPELLEFQPLGGGLSAKVKWQVKVRFFPRVLTQGGGNNAFNAFNPRGLLQFNYETGVTYTDDGYSQLSIRGTMEIPITRSTQASRNVTTTVDNYRQQIENRIFTGIDLTRFRVTRREFNVSRDKRTMEWDYGLEELAYMDLPFYCTLARGTYDVKPAKAGMGLCLWLCTLRATYTLRGDAPRRIAWLGFLALLQWRMAQSLRGVVPTLNNNNNQNPSAPVGNPLVGFFVGLANAASPFTLYRSVFQGQQQATNAAQNTKRAFLIDFSFNEGVYLDSKTVSFSATWRLATMFSHILLASGLWNKLPERDGAGNNIWASTVRDISGQRSWLPNQLDPTLDVIVDFGGG